MKTYEELLEEEIERYKREQEIKFEIFKKREKRENIQRRIFKLYILIGTISSILIFSHHPTYPLISGRVMIIFIVLFVICTMHTTEKISN